MAKCNFNDNGDKKMKFSLLDRLEDDECNGAYLGEVSKTSEVRICL